jgi:hypothetical protein
MPDTVQQARAVLADEISSLRLELELAPNPAERVRIGEALDQAQVFLDTLALIFA